MHASSYECTTKDEESNSNSFYTLGPITPEDSDESIVHEEDKESIGDEYAQRDQLNQAVQDDQRREEHKQQTFIIINPVDRPSARFKKVSNSGSEPAEILSNKYSLRTRVLS